MAVEEISASAHNLEGEFVTGKRRHENQLRFDNQSAEGESHLIDWANVTENQVLNNLLTNLREEIRGETEVRDLVASTATAATAALTAGYAIWALKSGHLLASLLASMPAWRHIDPLPVLTGADEEQEDDESLSDIAMRGE